MEKKRLWLLYLTSGMAAGCGKQLKMPPNIQPQHRYDEAYKQQEKLLNAKEVGFSIHATQVSADFAINWLELVVVNPQGQPAAPDSVVHRARKLAHLLVANINNPKDYQLMTVTLVKQHDYLVASSTDSRTITYSIDSLR
ncbi:hypothetical protein GCM10027422_09960 [Hymenobacter arcticus]